MGVEEAVKEMHEKCNAHLTAVNARIAETVTLVSKQGIEINHLKQWQHNQNGSLRNMEASLSDIRNTMHNMQVDAVRGKPSWLVTILFTVLCSTIVGLIVAFVS